MITEVKLDFNITLKQPTTWFEKLINTKGRWKTLGNTIYAPDYVWEKLNDGGSLSDFTGLINHEKVHVSQWRKTGMVKWYFLYIVSKKFRFSQEIEGIATEMLSYDDVTVQQVTNDYAAMLAGDAYMHCAPSFEVARCALVNKYRELLNMADK